MTNTTPVMISPTRTAKEVILRHVIILYKKHLVIFEKKSKLLNMFLNILNYYESIYNNIKIQTGWGLAMASQYNIPFF